MRGKKGQTRAAARLVLSVLLLLLIVLAGVFHPAAAVEALADSWLKTNRTGRLIAPLSGSDPQLHVEIGPGNSYVLLENSQLLVRYEPFSLDFDQFAIRDFILKNVTDPGLQDQAGTFLDADARRGALAEASIIYDGPDRKTVYLAWHNRDNDPGVRIVHQVSIFPNQPFIQIEYMDIEEGINVVDLGRPGGTGSGEHIAYGGDQWVRDYVTAAYTPTVGSYYNRYPPDGVNDPANGGSLNFGGHFILGVYNPGNGIGYGRVMPVADTGIIKLLLDENSRKGFEFFPHPFFQAHEPFTGYLYGVTNGGSEIISFGQQLVMGAQDLEPAAYLPVVVKAGLLRVNPDRSWRTD